MVQADSGLCRRKGRGRLHSAPDAGKIRVVVSWLEALRGKARRAREILRCLRGLGLTVERNLEVAGRFGKRLGGNRTDVLSTSLPDDLQCSLASEPGAIWPVRSECLVHVRDAEDPCGNVEIFRAHAPGVAGAIESFVMQRGCARKPRECAHSLKDLPREHRM